MVKNLPANAGDTRDESSIPGSGRSLGRRHSSHSSSLAWKIPWTEEPSGLLPIGLQNLTLLKQLGTHTCLREIGPDRNFKTNKNKKPNTHRYAFLELEGKTKEIHIHSTYTCITHLDTFPCQYINQGYQKMLINKKLIQ